MTSLMAGMAPRDPATSSASGTAWQLVRDADTASAALRTIAQRPGPLDSGQVARELDAVVRAHSTVLRALFGHGPNPGAPALTQRLRTQLAAAVVSVLQAALGTEMETIAEESRLAIAGAILALDIAGIESPAGSTPLTEQQRVELLRSAIRGVGGVEGDR